MNKLIYIPSFDSGIAGYAAKKDYYLGDTNIPWKFWHKDFPEKYRHEYFLITAGHSYKKKNYREMFDFPETMNIFGDSGGYQIVTGKLKWEESLREKIFLWLEENSTIAINLDLPPRGSGKGNYHECLDISNKNFKYFADNQTGKVDFLNVIHGVGYDTYKHWYNTVKGYPFQGWSIGGATGKLISLMEAVIVLVENKEHLNPQNKWLHLLGVTSITELLVLAQIQRSLYECGSNLKMTTDSSTPSRCTTFGYYYTAYDLKNLKFQYIRIPRVRDEEFETLESRLPKVTALDDHIWDTYNVKDFVKFETPHYVWLIAHNYAVFYDAVEWCNTVIYSHPDIRNQFLTRDMVDILNYIDEIIKSDMPKKIYNKYIEKFLKMAKSVSDIGTSENQSDFF